MANARWREAVAELYPGTFALVMATGVVSNASYFLGHRTLSTALLAVNLVAFPALVSASLARGLLFGERLWRDLTDPRLVFSFFTLVAGCDVLGIQLHLRGFDAVASALGLIALGVWVVLGYFSFAVLTFLNTRRGADVIHGGWLIAIVGTQSLVLLGALLAPGWGRFAVTIFVAVHALWGIGLCLYGIFMTLFAYRIFFVALAPADVTPLFWVVMGAAAISTNAGSTLILAEPGVPFLLALRPFVEGTTLVLWAWSTWWLPLLVVFAVWKHVVRREPVTYHPAYWSVVFPLGMYPLATYRLSLAADFPVLQALAHAMLWVALGAWACAFYGLLRGLLRPSAAGDAA